LLLKLSVKILIETATNCQDDYLLLRFLGRVLGKADFDQELVAGHLVQYLFKHLLVRNSR
jgi:hypothetical protein